MLLKNGNAAKKMKTRNAAATQRNRMRTCSFAATNIFDSPDAIVVALPLLRRFYHRHCDYGKRKAAVVSGPPLETSILPEQEFYEDLYLTEQP